MAGLVSREQKVSVALLLNGVVVLVVTMVMPYWFQRSEAASGDVVYMGLWKICGQSDDDECVSLNGSPSWITGPEILECISLTCATAALGLSFRMIFHKTKPVCLLTAILASVGGLLGLVGALVFRQKVGREEEVAWCFPLNVAANALAVVSGIVLYLHFFLLTRMGYAAI